MTLIEVVVAITVLLVGVLGMVTMIDGANATTSKTKAREGATHLGRQILEISRSIPYRDLTSAAVEAELTSRPGLADAKPGSPGYQILSRKFTYDVAIGVCSLDDPKDRMGTHNVAVTFCPGNDGLPSGAPPPKDRNPDDFRRVAVTLSWTARPGAVTDTTRQTTIVTNPVGGLGPSVIDLKMRSLLSPITGATPELANTEPLLAKFDVKTDLSAETVLWSINGAVQGSASGSGTEWSFDWPFVRADGSPTVFDGTYLVRAEAFDEEGRTGTADLETVVVNRMLPLPPTQVEGGRNLNGNRVDVEWQASPEPDVVGYRVYRSTTAGVLGTRVCPAGTTDNFTTKTSCLDEDAPAPLLSELGIAEPSLYYTVVALDRTTPGGALREGLPSGIGPIAEGNTAPTKPSGLTACTGGAPDCNDADGQPAPTGTTVLAWNPSTDADGIKFYRVYRAEPPELADT